jgi:hypothetical protein
MIDEQSPSDNDLNLPDALRNDLASLYPHSSSVPPHVDSMILSAARIRLARRRRMFRIVRWSSAVAAAAIVVFVLRVNLVHAPSAPQLAQTDDINHDGRVDILDAYVVARAIAHHQALPAAWDVNGDGVVDQKDVDLIANSAVHIGGSNVQ